MGRKVADVRLSLLLVVDLADALTGGGRMTMRRASARLKQLGGRAWFRADSRPDSDPEARAFVACIDPAGRISYEEFPRSGLPADVPPADVP